MKRFAYFLPQFHEIPENDLWWGKGFTEWVNVRGAKPLYHGHAQPRTPLNDRYYNLLDKETVEWQTSLMSQYGVDGLIYYHYYFKGKLLLEKPAENLLRWKEINQPFFFCWANHPWIRSWEGKSEVIMPLEYGDEEDWERHFQYLLPFFRDERYEKKDNMPLFGIFKSDFPEKEKMLRFLNGRCVQEGFSGLYIIETYSGEIPYSEFSERISSCTKRIVFREPAIQTFAYDNNHSSLLQRGRRKALRILRSKGILKKPNIYEGSLLMQQKIDNYREYKNAIPCIWFEWDNTPRHKQRGYVITPYQKELFFEYMRSVQHTDYLFINAWNEWAEGMILEPTEENGYRYLEWISEWVEEHDR